MEIEIESKAKRIGGSIMAVIPAHVVKNQNIRDEDTIIINVKKKRIDGFGLMKGLKEFREEDRMEDRE